MRKLNPELQALKLQHERIKLQTLETQYNLLATKASKVAKRIKDKRGQIEALTTPTSSTTPKSSPPPVPPVQN